MVEELKKARQSAARHFRTTEWKLEAAQRRHAVAKLIFSVSWKEEMAHSDPEPCAFVESYLLRTKEAAAQAREEYYLAEDAFEAAAADYDRSERGHATKYLAEAFRRAAYEAAEAEGKHRKLIKKYSKAVRGYDTALKMAIEERAQAWKEVTAARKSAKPLSDNEERFYSVAKKWGHHYSPEVRDAHEALAEKTKYREAADWYYQLWSLSVA